MISDKVNFPDEYRLNLDEAEKELDFNVSSLPFTDPNGLDIIGVIGQILQVGDALWFQITRGFGNNIFDIRIEESNKGTIYGITFNVRVVRDVMYYLKTYGGRLSALGGAILAV